MSRLSSWFGAARPNDTDPKRELETEIAHLQQAMRGTSLLINDDIDGAQAELEKGDSSYHDLGSALVFFMKSVLGFEKENMTKAADLLAKCETRAWNDLKRAQKRAASGHAPGAVLYPPGTEYELVVAQTQIMSAVIGVLHESIIEGMKSFLKLRRAYIILDGIIAKEKEHSKKQATSNTRPSSRRAAAAAQTNGSDVDSSDAKDTTFSGTQTPLSSNTSLEVDGATEKLASLRINAPSPGLREIDAELTNPIDAFIHSGANMCMGMLMLMLSLMPPAFGRILSVVGFKGDREAGIHMLWQSVAHSNINGAVAGIMLLSYYHSILELVDIQPHAADFDESAEPYGTPHDKTANLLAVMRARFPDSRMWLIEEAKGFAVDKDLPAALAKLDSGAPSKMKQITAINDFALSVFSMSAQEWVLMRKYFLRCLEVNDWSSALYYYMAGAASLELYRDAHHKGDATEAKVEKEKAETYFRKINEVAAKKKFMARQLPFETFIQRKLAKWEERAKALGVDLADAVAVSPALEMIYMWNGQKYMSAVEYERAESNLAWSRLTAPADKVDKLKERDEMGVYAVCFSSILRGANRLTEARTLIDEEVLAHDKNLFKGGNKEDYIVPAAIHEIAAIAWAECGQPPADLDGDQTDSYQKSKTVECETNLEKARASEAYVLDARMGMRIQSALATVAWYRKKKGWTA